MRLNRPIRQSQSVIVRMAEDDENEWTDENEIYHSAPTETGRVGGMKILLQDILFKAGSTLKGEIRLDRGLPQISNVSVLVTGIGITQFSSDDGKEYKAKHEFLNQTLDLGGVNQLQQVTNEISVPFEYSIPSDAPPSFIGNYGSITYECKAILRFSSPLIRRRMRKAEFRVLAKRNPNDSCASTPIEDGGSHPSTPIREARLIFYTHRLISLGFNDGEVDFSLQTDATCLRRGRTRIRIELELTNRTDLHLRDFRYGILMSMEWNAKGRRITERKFIAEEKADDFCLRPGKIAKFDKTFGPIPVELPPSVEFVGNGMDKKPICRCAYTVFAKLVPPNFAKTSLVEIPIHVY